RTALIQVLGAVAYGELKAHEGLVAEAGETADEQERERLLTFAGQELRHHRGFVARLEAMGADPERAMRPYRRPLDTYHGRSSSASPAASPAGSPPSASPRSRSPCPSCRGRVRAGLWPARGDGGAAGRPRRGRGARQRPRRGTA